MKTEELEKQVEDLRKQLESSFALEIGSKPENSDFDVAGKYYCGVDFGIVDPKTIYVN